VTDFIDELLKDPKYRHRIHAADAAAGRANGHDRYEESTARGAKAEQGPASALAFDLIDWDTRTAFVGEAPPQRSLVSGSIPMGVCSLVAAAGDTGKSYTVLELCDRVSMGPAPPGPERPILGGLVQSYGPAVFITAEDAKGSVHRRIRALDPDGSRAGRRQHPLYVVPLPDAGGPFALVAMERNRLVATEQYWALREQLLKIRPAVIAFDPLQVFVQADLNKDVLAAAFVMVLLNQLAAETGAAVLVLHHVRKDGAVPKSLQDARQMIRGTSALVDQARVAIVLWTPEDGDIRKTCKHLGADYAPNAIVRGGVVKANDGASRKIWTLHRQPSGLLRDVSTEASAKQPTSADAERMMVEAITEAATQGRPFTKTGTNGLYQRRAELPAELAEQSRHRLEEMAQALLEGGKAVLALARGSSSVKWLDVPDGQFARGVGTFAPGAGTGAAGGRRPASRG
jgi:hypothetical protein